MSTHDYYRSLGLDPAADSASLVREIGRLEWGADARRPERAEELRQARHILGDPDRRARYDALLAEEHRRAAASRPAATAAGATGATSAWGPAGQAAAPDTFSAAAAPNAAPAPEPEQDAGNAKKKEPERRGLLPVIAGTALATAAVCALIGAGAWWATGSENAGETAAPETVTETATTTASPSEAPEDARLGEVRALAEEFVGLREREQIEGFIRAHGVPNQLDKQVDHHLGEGKDFSPEAVFGTPEPKVLDVVDGTANFATRYAVEGVPATQSLADHGVTALYLVTVGNAGNDQETASLAFMERDDGGLQYIRVGRPAQTFTPEQMDHVFSEDGDLGAVEF
ncbi:hypothetical protein [Corynebacterium frankenforstense]